MTQHKAPIKLFEAYYYRKHGHCSHPVEKQYHADNPPSYVCHYCGWKGPGASETPEPQRKDSREDLGDNLDNNAKIMLVAAASLVITYVLGVYFRP